MASTPTRRPSLFRAGKTCALSALSALSDTSEDQNSQVHGKSKSNSGPESVGVHERSVEPRQSLPLGRDDKERATLHREWLPYRGVFITAVRPTGPEPV